MENQIRIDFNNPTLVGRELEYISRAFDLRHTAGDGSYSKKSMEILEQKLGVRKALLTTNCTHALEMAAILLDIQPGDEVILPSFTFVSTVNAFVLRGAKPVFVDIHPDTLNMNEKLLPALITDRTRAIVPVHYAGVGCEMEEIMRIAGEHSIPVVEDNAHGLFGKRNGKFLGTYGALATQSFHETKNISCGEGGALLVNDPELVERAEIIREKGTNRSRFFRGMVDKYTWVDVGSSYLMSDLLAAVLYAQLEASDEIQEKRKQIWNYYEENLRGWAMECDVQIPTVPECCEQAYHMFYMILPSLEVRTNFIQYLKNNGIISVFHYQPLHLSDMGLRFGGKPGDCPVTERVSDCLVRLPFYTNLTREDQDTVIRAIRSFQF